SNDATTSTSSPRSCCRRCRSRPSSSSMASRASAAPELVPTAPTSRSPSTASLRELARRLTEALVPRELLEALSDQFRSACAVAAAMRELRFEVGLLRAGQRIVGGQPLEKRQGLVVVQPFEQ